MTPERALERALERGQIQNEKEARFEEFGLGFQTKLRAGFLSLVQEFPDRCVQIDGNRDAQDVGAEIERIVLERLS